MTREGHFEKLEQIIFDESRIVTYKIISRELKISVNEAKEYLQEFLEDHKSENLNATYFLSGLAEKEPGSPLKVYVVSKNNLEKTKKSLSEVTSCHVYSVCKAVLVDECALYRLDLPHNINEEEVRNCTVIKHPNIEIKAPVLSKTNGIKKEVKAAIPKKEGSSFFKNAASSSVKRNDKSEPAESSDAKETAKPVENCKCPKQSPDKKSESKAQKPNTLAAMWQKKEDKSNKSEGSKPDGKVKGKSPQETKQVPKNSILSMFSKQAERKTDSSSKKSSSVSESSKTTEESISTKEKFSAANESPKETEKIKEKKSSKPSSNKKKKTNARPPTTASKHKKANESDDEFQSKKSKRRRVYIDSDSDSEEEEDEKEDKARRSFLSPEEPMETETPTKPATPESDDEEPIPPTPPVVTNKGKKKVWKTIQKTFEDEDGFFVTKQEKVLVSEDDEDPLPETSKSKEVNKSNQFAYRKQASLTSFFKQK